MYWLILPRLNGKHPLTEPFPSTDDGRSRDDRPRAPFWQRHWNIPVDIFIPMISGMRSKYLHTLTHASLFFITPYGKLKQIIHTIVTLFIQWMELIGGGKQYFLRFHRWGSGRTVPSSPYLSKIDNPPLPDIELSFIFPTGMTPKGGLCTVAMTTTSINVNEKQLWDFLHTEWLWTNCAKYQRLRTVLRMILTLLRSNGFCRQLIKSIHDGM